jgi:predicted dinucleotide-binding enzyme
MTPAGVINEVVESLGDVSQKVIIDATNTIGPPRGPYQTAYHCLAAKTAADIVKCFNTTGSENMLDPIYHGQPIDMFMAGESERAKEVAARLSADAGFGTCIDFGGSDKVVLLEQLALCWINLAIMQRMGRGIAFTLLRR